MGLFLKSHFEDHPLFIKYLNPLVLASFSIKCFLWLFVNVALYNEVLLSLIYIMDQKADSEDSAHTHAEMVHYLGVPLHC